MSLSGDLLAQALTLAYSDTGKPRQVNLRRAESTAYYALFHLLTDDAATRLLPGSSSVLRARVMRSFQHTEMKKVCKHLQQPTLALIWRDIFPHGISPDLRIVTGVFVEAQEARHRADYDVSSRLLRSATFLLLDKVESAFAAWRRIRKSEEADIFLAAFAFASRWDR